MRLPIYLFTCVLGLATNLAVASTPDRVTVDGWPIYSSLDDLFFLRTDEGFNVSLRYSTEFKADIPILSTRPRQPAFVLKDGILARRGESFVAYYESTPTIYPPVLLPLRFSRNVGPDQAAGFVAVTDAKGLRLWALAGPPVVRELSDGQDIYVKPEGNIEPTERVRLRIVPINPRDELNLVDYDEHDDQEYLGTSELK